MASSDLQCIRVSVPAGAPTREYASSDEGDRNLIWIKSHGYAALRETQATKLFRLSHRRIEGKDPQLAMEAGFQRS
jgi:hypothetical protein